MSDYNNRDLTQEAWRNAVAANPQTQENKVSEQEQENPVVSKLQEAFNAAKNAIVEGTELAKIVHDLQGKVHELGGEVVDLQRNLEYVRSRNRELDEQVTQVRQARDKAITDASEQRQRAEKAEGIITGMEESAKWMTDRINVQARALDDARKERDDAMSMALEYESKLKDALAKLASIEALFTKPLSEGTPEPSKPVPHYLVQPRDEVGKFQPIEEPKTYGSGSQGSF